MKTKRNVFILFILSLVLLSCTNYTDYVKFDFHPGIPYITRVEMFKTKMFLNETVEDKLGIGLIAGVDENNNKFIIIASTSTLGEKTLPIDELNLNVSSLIKYEKLEQLIQIVDASINCWDLKQQETENVFYKFYVYPEHEEIRLSFNVIEFRGSFIYEYQNSVKGSVLHIFLADKVPYHKYVNKKEDLIEFKNLLMEGKSYLDQLTESDLIRS